MRCRWHNHSIQRPAFRSLSILGRMCPRPAIAGVCLAGISEKCRFLDACGLRALYVRFVVSNFSPRVRREDRGVRSDEHKEHTNMKPKNTICLWFNKDAHDAARFYATTFPDSKVTAVHEAPGDYPGGKKGDVLTVEFTVLGIPCLGLNGGPAFRHTEAFSFQIATENQEETDRYWHATVGNGGP